MITNKKNTGFTLVELSISIVIIMLIFSLITTASHIQNVTKLKKTIQEFVRYNDAYRSFEFQYDNIPGDLHTATQYWSGVSNGDGDKSIQWYTEGYYAWEHLDRADLVAGTYDGTTNGTYDAVPNVNVPVSAFSPQIVWSAFGHVNADTAALYLGVPTTSTARVSESSLIPKDAYYIDSKFDDGYPATGNLIIGGAIDSDNCIDNLSASPLKYDLDIATAACDPYFVLN